VIQGESADIYSSNGLPLNGMPGRELEEEFLFPEPDAPEWT